MPVLDTQHKRRSTVITTVIMALILLLIFMFGMKYQDPPEEYGVAINFGNSDVGSGEPVENVKEQTQAEEQEEVEEEVKEEVVEETPQEQVQEDVITDDTAKDVPVVEKAKEVTEAAPVKEVVKKEPAKKPKPKPSKATTDALSNLLNGNSSDGATKGEGDDDQQGVKGKETGDPNSSKYYGNGGSGSGGDYSLGGRNAISKPKRKPDCEEEGVVVVSIEVDRNGRVVKAVPGVKGTTNSAPCLLKPAKELALKTKWNADGNAPSKQKGKITYRFSLSQ